MSRPKESLLWELISPSGTKNYVYGSIHLQDKRVFCYTDAVLAHLEQVDQFATEVDMDQMDPIRWQQVFSLPADENLKSLIGPKHFKRLLHFNHRFLHYPTNQLERLSPFVVINLMSQAYFSKDQPMNLDTFFFESARQMGKQLSGLEHFEEQLSYVLRMSLAEQTKALKTALKNISKLKKQYDQALLHYQNQLINDLYQQTRKSLGKWRKLMINERNMKMAERFDQLTEKESLMAVIGAAHLPGKYGVLRLLKQKGFQIKAVNIQSNK